MCAKNELSETYVDETFRELNMNTDVYHAIRLKFHAVLVACNYMRL